ncbi:MAG: type II toxin-antitoxin system PemK/MazF family toxin [Pseudolysinimonas sp.]
MERVAGLKRGDIVTVAGGGYAGKPRPAIVLQDERFADIDTVVVCLLTTTRLDAPLLRVLVLADDLTGIASDSWAMVDKVAAVKRKSVGQRVGRATAEQLAEIERRLLVLLGIAD